ncbi:ATP-binding protein [Streptomyces sp. NRRL F-5065]|uniref:ATP-binding protein n=1 Tax=Streptomyces sp. NRRL F-5065 TaxID=1463855 RepID=UPI00131DA026|nr:ATP-binding protein [Streptomyces sp. NRRL F-5065]
MSTAGTPPEDPAGRLAPVDAAVSVPGARKAVVDVNHGIVSQGDNAINLVFQEGGYAQIPSLAALTPRQPEVLAAPADVKLFGRQALVETVVSQLTEGTSVQLYGDEGVGKSAIADAVHQRLRTRGTRGHVLRPRTGETGTLATLYERMATVFFGHRFLREVDETELRQAVATVHDVHITVVDSALDEADLRRLLQTFSGCTFLFTSPYRTLPDAAAAHHVQPLSPAAAIELLNSELGLELGPEGLRNLQFDLAYRMSEGRPQRLLLYARFIKASDDWRDRADRGPHDQPPAFDPLQLSPRHQAAALAVALSEPARRVLVALATFGTPLGPAWFAPVTGHPDDAGTERELLDRRLVVHAGDGYAITRDAAAAVRDLAWDPAPAAAAAEGLHAALARRETVATWPDPHLLLTVAQELNAGQQWALTTRFVRVAVSAALTAGSGSVALELYGLGRIAALRGGLSKDHAYYVHTEEQTRNLLEGDKAAVAAALLILSPPLTTSAVAIGGKGSGFFGKLATTVTTKAGLTAAAVTVAAATAVTVVVATTGDGKPAGCSEALAANSALNERDTRTPQDLAAAYRQLAGGMTTAAGKADDPALQSVFRQQAVTFNEKADNKEAETPPDNIHPDVTAALVSSEKLRGGIENLQALSSVCPLD